MGSAESSGPVGWARRCCRGISEVLTWVAIADSSAVVWRGKWAPRGIRGGWSGSYHADELGGLRRIGRALLDGAPPVRHGARTCDEPAHGVSGRGWSRSNTPIHCGFRTHRLTDRGATRSIVYHCRGRSANRRRASIPAGHARPQPRERGRPTRRGFNWWWAESCAQFIFGLSILGRGLERRGAGAPHLRMQLGVDAWTMRSV